MLGEAVGAAAQRAQLLHLPVHRLEGVDAPLMEHAPEGDQHIGHGGRIVAGPVVVEGGQVQMLRHDVQLVLPQVRQEVLGQDQGVDVGGIKVQPLPPAAGADEADVELSVVGRQRPPVHEAQKFRQRLPGRRGAPEHLVGDAGQAHDLRRQPAAGVHKGLEPLRHLTVSQHHRADLRDGLPVHLEAGGLDVEADDLPLQGGVHGAVDDDAVVHIVDEIALHAVEDLDLAPRGVPGVRKGLGHTVVRDGDGGVAPANGLVDDLLGVGQGVHVGHLGVQVQLHPLYRRGVLPLRMVDHVDVVGVELDVLAVPGGFHLPLNAQPHPRLDGTLQSLGLLGREVLLHRDGAGVVRHVDAHAPHAGAPGLPALEGKDLPRHGGGAHFQIQVPHGPGLCLDGVPHEDLPRPGLGRGAPGWCGVLCRRGGLFRRCAGQNGEVQLRPLKSIDRPDVPAQLVHLLPAQWGARRHAQGDALGGAVDAAAGHLCAGQLQPALRRQGQPGKHFQKRNVF